MTLLFLLEKVEVLSGWSSLQILLYQEDSSHLRSGSVDLI